MSLRRFSLRLLLTLSRLVVLPSLGMGSLGAGDPRKLTKKASSSRGGRSLRGERATKRTSGAGEGLAFGRREEGYSGVLREREPMGDFGDFGDDFHSSPACTGVDSPSTDNSLAADSEELRARREADERRELVAELAGDMNAVESDDSDRRVVSCGEVGAGGGSRLCMRPVNESARTRIITDRHIPRKERAVPGREPTLRSLRMLMARSSVFVVR